MQSYIQIHADETLYLYEILDDYLREVYVVRKLVDQQFREVVDHIRSFLVHIDTVCSIPLTMGQINILDEALLNAADYGVLEENHNYHIRISNEIKTQLNTLLSTR